jgi:hypothetical protein
VDIDDIGLGIEMVVPHLLQQHGPGHDLTAVTHEVLEQAELPGLQLDLSPGAPDPARQQVHLQIRDLQSRLGRLSVTSSNQGPEARFELGEGERLDQIIVPASLQPFDPIIDLSQSTEDENRSAVS